MEDNWFSIEQIGHQESAAQKRTEDFFGKGQKGFCDFALDGINLLIQGLFYLRDVDEFHDKEKWNDFNHALRTFSYYHYYRIIFTFKAAYNLLLQGYLTESSILMRHIVETFVRLRYIAKEGKIDLVDSTLAGYNGFKGKKFNVTYKTQFNDIAPGLYEYYRFLCDIAHGAMASHALKTDLSEGNITLDTGIAFKPEKSSFVINQFSVYLLAHIEFMKWIFPEIEKKRPESYAEINHEVLAVLWRVMKGISENEENKEWYDAVKQLVKV